MLNYAPQTQSNAKASSTSVPWRLLIIGAVLIVLSVLMYAGMEFGYKPYLNTQIAEADARISELSASLQEGQQKDVIGLYSQMYNISSLLSDHVYPSRVFTFLEQVLLPAIRLTSLDADLRKATIKIEGVASDMDTVTLQLATIQAHEHVSSAVLVSSQKQDTKDGGGVTFNIRIDGKGDWLTKTTTTTQ